MQTFLPYQSFHRSARVLDTKRLGKQRLECLQILDTLKHGGPWENHPAVLMWKGYRNALKVYMNVVLDEWEHVRGFRNDSFWFHDGVHALTTTMPPWLGDEDFHASHRSNLLRKDPIHYGKFGWDEPSDLPYVWPSVMSGGGD